MSWFDHLQRRWDQPDKAAIIWNDIEVTYGELAQRIALARGWLFANGLRPNQGLALQMPRSLVFIDLHLAAMSMGAWFVPINPASPPSEVEFILRDAKPRLAVLPDHVSAECTQFDPETVRAAIAHSSPMPSVPSPPETLACLCYTSGTTGRPKGARISHGNIAATVTALHSAWRWHHSDVLLHSLPLFHIHGLFVAQHGSLYAGATAHWMSKFDAVTALKWMARHGITIFMGVPTHYARFLRTPSSAPSDLSTVRLLTSGSAPLPARDHDAFYSRFGKKVLERYGMTEVGIVLSNPYDGPRVPGTVGYPLAPTQIQVVDPKTHRRVPHGQVGELWIKGPGVIAAYHERPEATAASIVNGWMRSGDLAREADDGRITLVGRSKDLIISGGLNVYPAEVEAALREHPDIQEVAVVGVPDRDLGERVVAALVCSSATTEDAVRAHVTPLLSRYKQPREYRFLRELPRNAMGKVQKHRIRSDW